ncbi:kinesin-like protein klp-3 isoform X2 [Dysidea avara]|uniref:kinesin-like protein klp-3 isoform X2 n=1 Tax=Dysidea avara TaxID=196820 RepID=UPI00332E9B44
MGAGASSRGSDRSQAQVVILQPTHGATSSTNHVDKEIINTALQSSKEVDNNPVGDDVARTAVTETSSNGAHVISWSAEPHSIESSEAPAGDEEQDMFTTFRKHNGEEYTVYSKDGKRYYVDWETQKWRHFPDSWIEEGEFVSSDIDPFQKTHKKEIMGEFLHLSRGKITTYLHSQYLNIMYYFDEPSGSWLPMPLSWEQHVPFVASRVDHIKSVIPGWKDTKSIIASLRQNNYSVDDCINVYLTINDDGMLDIGDHLSSASKDVYINQLKDELSKANSALKEANRVNDGLKADVEAMKLQIEELENEVHQLNKELDAEKLKQTKKRALYRASQFHLGRPIPSMVKINETLDILGGNARGMRSKLLALRSYISNEFQSAKRLQIKLVTALRQLLTVSQKNHKEVVELRTLYRKETLQRKLLYNQLQELRGNIRVFCRCRRDDSAPITIEFTSDNMVHCWTRQGRKRTFEFDRVFDIQSTQEQVFEDTLPTITSAVDGYNVCIIAYGQTSAGKTYTMMGTEKNPGINIRSIAELFRVCHERKNIEYKMKVSMLEVYNESISDLLSEDAENSKKLQILKKGKSIVIPGLTEIEVRSIEDLKMLILVGEKQRTVASTEMNTNSSRSHLILTISINDLAGSERISKTEATGQRLVEAAAINKSLTSLGQVFACLRNNSLHVPYRNSKLTHLLQPSLGGDSKACVFVNISPLERNLAESLSTLEFGQNIRQVELGKATKQITKIT